MASEIKTITATTPKTGTGGVVETFSWVDVAYHFTTSKLRAGKRVSVEQAAVRSSSGLVKKGEMVAVMGECLTRVLMAFYPGIQYTSPWSSPN